MEREREREKREGEGEGEEEGGGGRWRRRGREREWDTPKDYALYSLVLIATRLTLLENLGKTCHTSVLSLSSHMHTSAG